MTSTTAIRPVQKFWLRFVYQLLYPAFLGAMVYELFSDKNLPRFLPDHPTPHWYDPAFYSRLLIVVIFLMSWAYLDWIKNNSTIRRANQKQAWVIDLLSLIGFQIAFVYAIHCPIVTLWSMLIVALFYMVAVVTRGDSWGGCCAGLAIAVLGGGICICQDRLVVGNWCTPAVLLVVVVIYRSYLYITVV